jgi:hypothetical protein
MFFLSQKCFSWVRRGGWGNSTLFQKQIFIRDWRWGLTQRVVSWVAWVGKFWLFFKQGRWDFLIFQKYLKLVVWDGPFGESRWVCFVFDFFSFNMVI